MYKTLVLSSSMGQAEELHAIFAAGRYPDVAFRYPTSLPREGSTSLTGLFTQCCELLKEEDIDSVIATQPEHACVLAALCERFPQVPAPSMESVFLCMHRLYSKKLVLQGFNAVHKGCEVDDLETGTLLSDIEELGYPAILKDSYSLTDTLHQKIKSSKNFSKEFKRIESQLQDSIQYMKEFLEGRLNLAKYPLAFEATCVVEEPIPHGRGPLSLHYVEACVAEQTVLPWIISDISHFGHKPKYSMTLVSVPTRLNDSLQFQIWAVLREVAQKLINAGFNNHFFHAKIAVYKSGVIKFLDLVPCINRSNTCLYQHVFQDGDNIQGQIDLGLGRSPWNPRQMPGRAAIKAVVSTPLLEARLSELVDIKAAKIYPNTRILHHGNDIENEAGRMEGVPLLEVKATGHSYEECHEKIKTACSELLIHVPRPSPPTPASSTKHRLPRISTCQSGRPPTETGSEKDTAGSSVGSEGTPTPGVSDAHSMPGTSGEDHTSAEAPSRLEIPPADFDTLSTGSSTGKAVTPEPGGDTGAVSCTPEYAVSCVEQGASSPLCMAGAESLRASTEDEARSTHSSKVAGASGDGEEEEGGQLLSGFLAAPEVRRRGSEGRPVSSSKVPGSIPSRASQATRRATVGVLQAPPK